MFSNLCGWRINVGDVQEVATKELFAILDKLEGTKAIVWDETLSGPLGLITNNKYSFLKERNVKMLTLGGPLRDIDVEHIIYIIRPNLKLLPIIAEFVHKENKLKRKNKKVDFHLYFVPKRSLLCEKELEIKGVLKYFVNIGEFKCNLFPLDNDIISLELQHIYRELYIDNDPSSVYLAASALCSIQRNYGRIVKVHGKGNYAQKVWELTKIMGHEGSSFSDKHTIDEMIIIDRSIDIMSVLTTQLTYEGLIDEIFGIQQSTVHLPSDYFSKQDNPVQNISSVEKKNILLNSSDKLYAEIRDKHVNATGQILSSHAKLISQQFDERHGDKSVQDIKKFVERLPNMLAQRQSLGIQTAIAEMIKDITDSNNFSDILACEQDFIQCAEIDKISPFIEYMIARKVAFKDVIRLICIQSIASSGLKPKILDFYKRELVEVYGIEALITISNLEKFGLLKTQTGVRTYAVLRKTLNLTVEDAMEVDPKDISYVHTFYAPLTIRIVEQTLKVLGWQSMNDVLACVPGPTFEDFQKPLNDNGSRRGSYTSDISQSDIPRLVLIFFFGGCTFAEIAALRFLAQREENNVEFIIATTNTVNKTTFLKSFIDYST